MTEKTLLAPSAPTKLSDNTYRQSRFDAAMHAMLLAAAVVFTLASCFTNLLYGISKSDFLPTQIVFGAVAIAASVALALAPTVLTRRSVTGFLFAIVAIVLFGAFSLSGALGSFFGGRAASQVEQTTAEGTRARLEQSYTAAKAELASMASARPAAELEALVAKLKATPGANGCTKEPDGPISRKVCSEAVAVAVELGRAQRRAELEGFMASASRNLSKIGAPKVVNADAIALSTFADKIGVVVTPEQLNPWLALLAVALVEFGGGICFALAGVFSPPAGSSSASHIARVEHAPAVEEAAEPEIQAVSEGATGGTTTLPKLTLRDDDVSTRLMAMVQCHGIQLLGSTRTFGKALGVSHTQVGRVLDELEQAGRVTVVRGKSGTVVRLVA